MFMYYVRLAALSYRRNPILSSLMVLAVAAVSYTHLTLPTIYSV